MQSDTSLLRTYFRFLVHRCLFRKRLIFLHIPKTGGTTFSAIIRRNIAEPRIYRAYHINAVHEFAALPEETRERYSCIDGHMSFGWHTLFKTPSSYATFVRHPVDRVISLYMHAITWEDNYLYNKVVKNGTPIPIEEFVTSDYTVEIYNGQVRLLSTENGAPNGEFELRKADLDRALDHIDRFFGCVCIVEDYPTSLRMIRKKLGFWEVGPDRRLNAAVAKVKTEVFQSMDIHRVSELILERNQLDLLLYRHCKQKFYEVADRSNLTTGG